METPVLFLIFNRPNPTHKVFEAIRTAKPKRLYIAADGPRKSRAGERLLCEQTRKIIDEIDWECEVKTLFRSENMGCKSSVSDAIDWFFSNETSGIILEDDILPHPDFFSFCSDLLTKYENNERIGIISGHNHVYDETLIAPHSYTFVSVSHCWGWATWRETWKLVDLTLSRYSMHELKIALRSLNLSNASIRFWKGIYILMRHNMINSWAYPMTLSLMVNKRLSVIPSHNLTKNIGAGDDATHTSSLSDDELNIELDKIIYPLNHPETVLFNKIADDREIVNENRTLSCIGYIRIKIKVLLNVMMQKIL